MRVPPLGSFWSRLSSASSGVLPAAEVGFQKHLFRCIGAAFAVMLTPLVTVSQVPGRGRGKCPFSTPALIGGGRGGGGGGGCAAAAAAYCWGRRRGRGRTRIHVPYRLTKATQEVNLEGTKPHDPVLLKALEKGEE